MTSTQSPSNPDSPQKSYESNQPPLTHVVCAVLIHRGSVFVAQRAGGIWKNYWEFPGGKLEAGETELEALIREMKEELGWEFKAEDFSFFMRTIHSPSHSKVPMGAEVRPASGIKGIQLSAYLAELTFVPPAQPTPDHLATAWADIFELSQLKLAPADVPIIQELIKQNYILDLKKS